MTNTPIIKNNTPIANLPLQGNLQLVRELMGKNEIQIDVQVPNILLSPIGSHIEIKGKEYTVNTPPLRVEKLDDRLYNYSLMFESVLYRLYDKKLRHLGRRTFQFYGNLTRLAQLIVDNINEIDSGWTVGECDDVPEKIINFSGHTCRTALDTGAEAFGVEWENIDKEIRFTKSVGRTTTHVFEVGRGKGLYTLSYAYQNDKNIVTRAYGYGGTRNLPEGFKGTELTLPEMYLEGNTDKYGVKEGDYVNPDIFPEVKGVLSGVVAWVEDAATFKVQDTSLNFNVNDYISPQAAKLSFKSGELQGQEFEIVKFDNATKTYTLKTFVDGNNNTLPSLSQSAQVGDTYTLFDIFPPLEIEVDAINRLRVATQEYVNENKVPRVLYSMQLDPLYARNNNVILNPGDKVRIVDEALGIDELIRVTKVAYPPEFPEVLNPGDTITIEIANFIPYTLTERVISDVIDTKNEVKIVNRTNIERARVNRKATDELATMLDTLRAEMLLIMVDGGQYITDIVSAVDKDTFKTGSGTLHHEKYTEFNGEWNVFGFEGLIPSASAYYVYIKASKAQPNAQIVLSLTEIPVESEAGFYHFPFGIISSIFDNTRVFSSTKGYTSITGGNIRTGRIMSNDGLNYFDLDNGTFKLGDNVDGLDYGVTTPNELTVIGNVVARSLRTRTSPDLSGIEINTGNDNSIKIYHESIINGLAALGFEFGTRNGLSVLNIYDDMGNMNYTLGSNGLERLRVILESFRLIDYLHRVFNITSGNQLTQSQKDQIAPVVASYLSYTTHTEFDGQTNIIVRDYKIAPIIMPSPDLYMYEYNAGQNATTADNEQYNGVHLGEFKTQESFIENGWYVKTNQLLNSVFPANKRPPGDSGLVYVPLSLYLGGQVVANDAVVVPSGY